MWGRLKAALWVLVVPVTLAAALIADRIPVLNAPDVYFADNPGVKTLLIGLCIGMAVVGGLILIGAQFVVRRPRPEELTKEALGENVEAEFSPMDSEEVEELTASNRVRAMSPSIWSRYAYRLGGVSVGRSFNVEAPMRSVKEAWQAGAWRRNPVWRLLFIMAVGAALMVFGLFGLPVVTGPPLVRAIGAGAISYAVIRTAWALYKA
jgi:hypothetical protein